MNDRTSVNIDFLKENFNQVYTKVNGLHFDANKYEILASKCGSPNLIVRNNAGHELSFYSKYNPQHEVERWLESIHEQICNVKYILMYGLGFGYHLQQFINRYPDKMIYLYEPEIDILLAAIEAIDLQLLNHKQIQFFGVGKDFDTKEELFYRICAQVTGDFGYVVLPSYQKIFPTSLEEFEQHAQKSILNYRSSIAVNASFNYKWPENILNNLTKNAYSYSLRGLKDQCVELSAVIVGSGPSLQQDLHYLAKLKDHSLIIAAGTSLRILLKHNITPHLIVSMDGGDPNLVAFQNLDIAHLPFLYTPYINYKIIEHKHKYLIHAFFKDDTISQYHLRLTEDDPTFWGTHSVTGTAIQAAAYIGCKRIILAGQDLSYPLNQMYAPGAAHISQKYVDQVLETATESVENVLGGINPTTLKMKITLQDIEDLLRLYPDHEFINTTKHGASIKRTVWMPIEEVYNSLKHRNIESDWFIKKMGNHLEPYNKKRVSEMFQSIRSVNNDFVVMKHKLESIAKKMGKLRELSRRKPNQCVKMIWEIEQIWAGIAEHDVFKHILQFALHNELKYFDRHHPELVREQNVIRKSELICNILGPLVAQIRDTIPKLQAIYNKAIQRMDRSMA
ncbi:motility associated factor glycosyltransferase family protein [Paenibacillus sp. MSJ-34]|uniref:motility associated factor glycosyltransferase family protein n=1 Tax=Paenibacillus sp. MSJ-34 TaxID=2841529 RepID=UPI001C0FDC07|nr:6-hydroxymethylpterin diphosphokinase MptE-like protein [Paenibacillus sp. MSJ-34]MBU5440992.1 DUF115 domain-containing protein [Paenibacillus sp. MSJ-34]